MYSVTIGCVKLRFGTFRLRERVRNLRLPARYYHFCYALSTQRWVSDTETATIPGNISIIPPQVKRFMEMRKDWRNSTKYGYEIVI